MGAMQARRVRQAVVEIVFAVSQEVPLLPQKASTRGSLLLPFLRVKCRQRESGVNEVEVEDVKERQDACAGQK